MNKIPVSLLLGIIILYSSVKVNCEVNQSIEEKNEDEKIISSNIDNFSNSNSNLKSGPIKIEIIGDTSHLFADEDFERKEAVYLHQNNNDTLSNQESSKIEKEEANNNTITKRKNQSSNPNQLDCLNSNLTVIKQNNIVQMVNGSYLTHLLSESEATKCFLVLFYVPWCPFSTKLAPIYNALPRAFTNLDILAFDIEKSFGYNTKFGTSAVPMILLFQHKNVIAKFNFTNKNLSDYLEFISKNTGFDANKSVLINENDLVGPVPTVTEIRFDYSLLISWIFVLIVSIDFLIRKTRLTHFIEIFFTMILRFLRVEKLPQLPQPLEVPAIQHHNPHLHSE